MAEPDSRRALVRRSIALLTSSASIGLLVWLLHRLGWEQMAESLVRIGAVGALVLVVLGFAEQFCDTKALQLLLPARIGLFRLAAYTSAGALVNIVVPWDAGEVLKAGLLRRHMTGRELLSGLLLWNYLTKLSRPIVSLGAGIAGALASREVDPASIEPVLIGLVLSFAPLVVLRTVLQLGPTSSLIGLLVKLRILRRDPTGWLASARDIDQRVRGFYHRHPRAYLSALVLQMGGRAFSGFAIGVTLALLEAPYAWGTVALIVGANSVANYIVVLIPARVGVAEAAGYLVFEFLGLDPAMGLVMMLIMRIKSLVSLGLTAVWIGAPPPRSPRGASV